MSTIRLAIIILAAGLLMAPGLGNVSIGDGTATLPIGDQSIGDRFGVCTMAVPGSPKNHYGARVEGLASGTITGLVDQGSGSLNMARQAAGVFTVVDGCVSGQKCITSGGTDSMITAVVSAIAQPVMVCGTVRMDATSTGSDYFWSGVAASKRHDVYHDASSFRAIVNGNFGETTGTTTEDVFHHVCAYYDTSSSWLRVNGTQTSGDTGAADSYRGFGLFGYAPSNASHVTGSIAEVMVYTSDSSFPAAADVEAYLECWYGAGG